jgi:acetyl-CoA C-acetyltransferase
MKDVVIVSAARTPIAAFLGGLAGVSAPELGAAAIRAALERARIDPQSGEVDEVLMGCVLPAGMGQAPARQAALKAGLPQSTPCTTVNKVCGSSLKAVMMAVSAIRAEEANVIVAGGMESMSNTPYLLSRARTGYRMGNAELVDSMIKDGLWDVYNDYHMGSAAELCARECDVTRDAQDEHAIESYRRARAAWDAGKFAAEVTPVLVPQRKGDPVAVAKDEEPWAAPLEKLKTLRPVFQKDGTVTAGNASTIDDGGAAVVLMSAEHARAKGLTPLARIVAQGQAAQAPEWFTTAPALSIERTLSRAGLKADAIDLYEINEAFSVVAVANNRKLGLDPAKVNVHGGAVALGHPIGASGARILTTLVYAMADRGAKLGCASLCIGGGEAVALVVER